MVTSDKTLLRRVVRAALKEMPEDEKRLSSLNICRSVKAHLAVCGARVVALFSPLPDEPYIAPLIEELSKNMLVVLPRVEGDIMQFYSYTSGSVSLGSFGIMEPEGTGLIEPWEIDAMVVPGVAFTADGARMGRGKGFYDKYLSQEGFRALKIGVCYPVQLVESLPVEEHDVKMDVVIY